MKGKLVHAGGCLVLLLLIGKLQDLTSSWLEFFEILLFLISCTGIHVTATGLEPRTT